MERLWAPWRMPYIERSDPMPGCLFCLKLAENTDEENLILLRSAKCFVMMNLFPYNSGHLMIVPYQHTGQFDQVDAAAGAEVFQVAQMAVHILDEVITPDGFNLGINQGKTAGAGVADHIHLHVVPRWDGDTNFMPVLADVKVMPEHLRATAAKLRPLFDRYGKRT